MAGDRLVDVILEAGPSIGDINAAVMAHKHAHLIADARHWAIESADSNISELLTQLADALEGKA